MQYENSTDDSRQHLRLALKYIGKYGLAADPMTYSLWYEYASGKNQALNKTIDSYLENTDVFSEDFVQRLYIEYVADSKVQVSQLVQEQLKMLLVKIIDVIEQTTQNYSHSENNLGKIKDGLSRGLSIKEVDQLVDLIKYEIKQLESNSASLQDQLQHATDEINQLRAKMVQYREESKLDPLTKIYNRRGFTEKMNIAIKESVEAGTTLCLIMADIDHFKKINDTYGHIVGDNVLRIVAKTLEKYVKGKDLVARIGGEEFAILLPDTPIEGAMKLAENIRSVFEELDLKKKDSRERLEKVSLSFGVTFYMSDEIPESFIKRADEALYYSKKGGRNKVTGL